MKKSLKQDEMQPYHEEPRFFMKITAVILATVALFAATLAGSRADEPNDIGPL